MEKIAKPVEKLASIFEATPDEAPPSDEKEVIKVSALASRVASLYEKVRNAVDVREEHLLLKNSIKRNIRRRYHKKITGKEIAKPLISELIRGGYLENETVTLEKVKEVRDVLDKYFYIINKTLPRDRRRDTKEYMDWYMELASSEIGEMMVPSIKEKALAECMYKLLNKRVVFKDKKITPEEKNIQVYLAVKRVLLKPDRGMLSYDLLRLTCSIWEKPDRKDLNIIVRNIDKMKKYVDERIDNPVRDRLIRKIRRYTPLFIVLEDILEENKDDMWQILGDPDFFADKIKEAASEEYKKLKGKLRRRSIRSIIYILVTKMALALLLEVPYDIYVEGSVNQVPLIINIVFHPLFLFLMVALIFIPKEKNTKKIIELLQKFVYSRDSKDDNIIIKRAIVKKGIARFLLNLFYAIIFILTFTLLILGLRYFEFNIFSGALFILFLSLVSYFGLKVRRLAKEFIVIQRKDNVFTFIADMLAIPIIRMGRWISVKFSRINFFVFFLDFFIEAPFKVLIEVFEDWVSFLREKKEDID